MLIEILFLTSQFQCGSEAAQATFKARINDKPIYVGETVRLNVENLQDLYFEYEQLETFEDEPICALPFNTEGVVPILIQYGEQLPTNDGIYNQPSLQTLIQEQVTNEYLNLVLYEVGTTDTNSSAYDLQDLVFVINTNVAPYAD